MRLLDFDTVTLSNLQRQILFKTSDLDAPKIACAEAALTELNPHVDVDARLTRIDAGNAADFLDGADIVLDGSDSFETRFAVNAACRLFTIPLISGAVGRWEGQVATFKQGGPCYQCLVPEAPPDAETCVQTGVVGALTGVIGSMMALEAIKELTQAGDSLAGRLLLYDGLAAQARIVTLPRDPACPICSHE